jgi:replication factor C large subunit
MGDVWIRKHAPKKASEIVGQGEQVERLRRLVREHRRGKKPIFLYGGVGNGKTSSVHALANDLDLELMEINASDTRNADAITSLLSGVLNQASLFGASKLILIDEVEGLSGAKDRGGLQALLRLVPDSRYPVVLIAHDAYEDKLKELRKESELIEFVQLSHEEVLELLRRVCEKEKIKYDEEALAQLARLSGGDARAVINDLQTISAPGGKLTPELVGGLGERNTTKSIEESLKRVFKTTDPDVALGAFDEIDEDIDKVFLWVEENLPKEYLKPVHLAAAFDNLSLADVFYGRIRRWRYYRFYVYCYNLMTAGVALSKDKKYPSAAKYTPTSRLLKIWIYNNANARKKAIAQKFAAVTHTSSKRAYRDTVPFFHVLFKHDRNAAAAIAGSARLSEEETDWLRTK